MADIFYNEAKKEIADQTIDLLNNTLKIMLVTSSYVANADDKFIEEGANDANEHEINVTNYTPGYGSASRKTIGNKAIAVDDANDRAEFDSTDDQTWTSLGSGATIAGVILVKEITNDTASRLIAYFDVTNTATNGGDIVIAWNAEGLLQW